MSARIITRIYKDDSFKTVGLTMSITNSEGCTIKSVSHGYTCRGDLYVKETTADYLAEFIEICELMEKKDTLTKFESNFFDVALKSLGEKAIDCVGFDFSKTRKEIGKCDSRIEEIVKSIL